MTGGSRCVIEGHLESRCFICFIVRRDVFPVSYLPQIQAPVLIIWGDSDKILDETGVVRDLQEAIERLAPIGISYRHDAKWGDGNGYAHVRAALLGPSLTVPLIKSRLVLGTWQQIVLVDFDNEP